MPNSIDNEFKNSSSLAHPLFTRSLWLTCLLGLLACAGAGSSLNAGAISARDDTSLLVYPETHRSDQVDDYFGEKVADPYRWMEDLDNPEVKSWVEAQNKSTFGYLEKIPQRNAIKERLRQLYDYERYGLPVKSGDRYFYLRNDGLRNQSVLYIADGLDAEPRVLLDPNTLLADGTAALAGWIPNEDGSLLLYGIAEGGADRTTWRVREVATGNDLEDRIDRVRYSSPAWLKDGSGFFYSRFDEPEAGEEFEQTIFSNKLYFHKLGDPASKDTLIYERPDQEKWVFQPIVSDDGRFLLIFIWQGSGRTNQIFYHDLETPDAPVKELITGFDAAYLPVGNDGGRMWFQTNYDAPMGRLIEVDIARPERSNWETIIPETSEALQAVSLVGDTFFATYLKDAWSKIKMFDQDGTFAGDVEAPERATVGGFSGSPRDTETFYVVTDFVNPASTYRYDLNSGQSSLFKQPALNFDPADFETKQVFVTSKDGTRVPMFLTYRRGPNLDGDNPTLMWGYGGFAISRPPIFLPETIVFLEQGGVYAHVNLRGGFEYGHAWHRAGQRENKQNVFDDFIAAAEWLIDNEYTRPDRLAVRGHSNGGLLIGAVLTQRPELFGATLPEVGVLDMLRFQNFTIGWAWAEEWGSSDNAEQFRYLRAYSPVHNVRSGIEYPATLVTTGDHDDRVPPFHSYKFTAALQHAQAGQEPILIRVDTRTGHGAGRPVDKRIDLAADWLAFLHKALDMNK